MSKSVDISDVSVIMAAVSVALVNDNRIEHVLSAFLLFCKKEQSLNDCVVKASNAATAVKKSAP